MFAVKIRLNVVKITKCKIIKKNYKFKSIIIIFVCMYVAKYHNFLLINILLFVCHTYHSTRFVMWLLY